MAIPMMMQQGGEEELREEELKKDIGDKYFNIGNVDWGALSQKLIQEVANKSDVRIIDSNELPSQYQSRVGLKEAGAFVGDDGLLYVLKNNVTNVDEVIAHEKAHKLLEPFSAEASKYLLPRSLEEIHRNALNNIGREMQANLLIYKTFSFPQSITHDIKYQLQLHEDDGDTRQDLIRVCDEIFASPVIPQEWVNDWGSVKVEYQRGGNGNKPLRLSKYRRAVGQVGSGGIVNIVSPPPGGLTTYTPQPPSQPPPGGLTTYTPQPPSQPPPGGLTTYTPQPPSQPPPGGLTTYTPQPTSILPLTEQGQALPTTLPPPSNLWGQPPSKVSDISKTINATVSTPATPTVTIPESPLQPLGAVVPKPIKGEEKPTVAHKLPFGEEKPTQEIVDEIKLVLPDIDIKNIHLEDGKYTVDIDVDNNTGKAIIRISLNELIGYYSQGGKELIGILYHKGKDAWLDAYKGKLGKEAYEKLSDEGKKRLSGYNEAKNIKALGETVYIKLYLSSEASTLPQSLEALVVAWFRAEAERLKIINAPIPTPEVGIERLMKLFNTSRGGLETILNQIHLQPDKFKIDHPNINVGTIDSLHDFLLTSEERQAKILADIANGKLIKVGTNLSSDELGRQLVEAYAKKHNMSVPEAQRLFNNLRIYAYMLGNTYIVLDRKNYNADQLQILDLIKDDGLRTELSSIIGRLNLGYDVISTEDFNKLKEANPEFADILLRLGIPSYEQFSAQARAEALKILTDVHAISADNILYLTRAVKGGINDASIFRHAGWDVSQKDIDKAQEIIKLEKAFEPYMRLIPSMPSSTGLPPPSYDMALLIHDFSKGKIAKEEIGGYFGEEFADNLSNIVNEAKLEIAKIIETSKLQVVDKNNLSQEEMTKIIIIDFAKNPQSDIANQLKISGQDIKVVNNAIELIQKQAGDYLVTIEKRNNALDILKRGGYITFPTPADMKKAAVTGDISKAKYNIEVQKLLKENPSLSSVQLLQDVGFTKEVIDSATRYVNGVQDLKSQLVDNYNNDLGFRLVFYGEAEKLELLLGHKGASPSKETYEAALKQGIIPKILITDISEYFNNLSPEEQNKLLGAVMENPNRGSVFAALVDRTNTALNKIPYVYDVSKLVGVFVLPAIFLPIFAAEAVAGSVAPRTISNQTINRQIQDNAEHLAINTELTKEELNSLSDIMKGMGIQIGKSPQETYQSLNPEVQKEVASEYTRQQYGLNPSVWQDIQAGLMVALVAVPIVGKAISAIVAKIVGGAEKIPSWLATIGGKALASTRVIIPAGLIATSIPTFTSSRVTLSEKLEAAGFDVLMAFGVVSGVGALSGKVKTENVKLESKPIEPITPTTTIVEGKMRIIPEVEAAVDKVVGVKLESISKPSIGVYDVGYGLGQTVKSVKDFSINGVDAVKNALEAIQKAGSYVRYNLPADTINALRNSDAFIKDLAEKIQINAMQGYADAINTIRTSLEKMGEVGNYLRYDLKLDTINAIRSSEAFVKDLAEQIQQKMATGYINALNASSSAIQTMLEKMQYTSDYLRYGLSVDTMNVLRNSKEFIKDLAEQIQNNIISAYLSVSNNASMTVRAILEKMQATGDYLKYGLKADTINAIRSSEVFIKDLSTRISHDVASGYTDVTNTIRTATQNFLDELVKTGDYLKYGLKVDTINALRNSEAFVKNLTDDIKNGVVTGYVDAANVLRSSREFLKNTADNIEHGLVTGYTDTINAVRDILQRVEATKDYVKYGLKVDTINAIRSSDAFIKELAQQIQNRVAMGYVDVTNATNTIVRDVLDKMKFAGEYVKYGLPADTINALRSSEAFINNLVDQIQHNIMQGYLDIRNNASTQIRNAIEKLQSTGDYLKYGLSADMINSIRNSEAFIKDLSARVSHNIVSGYTDVGNATRSAISNFLDELEKTGDYIKYGIKADVINAMRNSKEFIKKLVDEIENGVATGYTNVVNATENATRSIFERMQETGDYLRYGLKIDTINALRNSEAFIKGFSDQVQHDVLSKYVDVINASNNIVRDVIDGIKTSKDYIKYGLKVDSINALHNSEAFIKDLGDHVKNDAMVKYADVINSTRNLKSEFGNGMKDAWFGRQNYAEKLRNVKEGYTYTEDGKYWQEVSKEEATTKTGRVRKGYQQGVGKYYKEVSETEATILKPEITKAGISTIVPEKEGITPEIKEIGKVKEEKETIPKTQPSKAIQISTPKITKPEIGGLGAIDLLFAPIKGLIARIRPDILTGSSMGFESDIARIELPEGMTHLAARQIIEDVQSAQLVGEIPIDRLASYVDISKGIPDNIKSVEVVRDIGKGTIDIVLKSSDGNAVGHVSGFQRAMRDFIFTATSETNDYLKQYAEKGYIEVIISKGKYPFIYTSQQPAQIFALKDAGESPGLIAFRISPDMWRLIPKRILDGSIGTIKDRMIEEAKNGTLEPGVYAVAKGYKFGDNPFKFEYEIIIAPKTRFYPLKGTWYAPAMRLDPTIVEGQYRIIPDNEHGVPMIKYTSDVAYDGSAGGKSVNFGDTLPIYLFGTEEAVKSGLGVPSIVEIYKAKLLGDLTAIRKWLPWNIRIRPQKTYETTGIYSINPLYSEYRALKLKATPQDIDAGKVGAIISDNKGNILVVRYNNEDYYELPGGQVVKGETPSKAIIGRVFEETSLKPTYVEKIDIINPKIPSQIDITDVREIDGVLTGDKFIKQGDKEVVIEQAPTYQHPTLGGEVRRRVTTVVVDKDGNILLGTDRAEPRGFHGLLGGALSGDTKDPWTLGESAEQQVLSETGIGFKNGSVEKLPSYLGKPNRHSLSGSYIIFAEADKTPIDLQYWHRLTKEQMEKGEELEPETISEYYRRPELKDAIWWNGKTEIEVSPATYDIIARLVEDGKLKHIDMGKIKISPKTPRELLSARDNEYYKPKDLSVGGVGEFGGKYQLFEVETTGEPTFNREIAEYAWWDGKSKLNRELSPLAKEAIAKKNIYDSVITDLSVDKVIKDTVDKYKAEGLDDKAIEEKVKEELESLSNKIDGDIVAYRGMDATDLGKLGEELAIGTKGMMRQGDVPLEIKSKISSEDVIIGDKEITDTSAIDTEKLPARDDSLYEDTMAKEYLYDKTEEEPILLKDIIEEEMIQEYPKEQYPKEEYPKERYPREQYPTEQPTYPPEKPIYPPEKPTYPPEKPIYPPEKPTYPPEKPIYPPEKPTYPPEKPIYPPILSPIPFLSEAPGGKKVPIPYAAYTHRQGKRWMYVTREELMKPDLKKKVVWLKSDEIPEGIYKYATGKGSARKTAQILPYGAPFEYTPEKPAIMDMGFMTVKVYKTDDDIKMEYLGGKKAAEERWAEQKAEEAKERKEILTEKMAQEALQREIKEKSEQSVIQKQEAPITYEKPEVQQSQEIKQEEIPVAEQPKIVQKEIVPTVAQSEMKKHFETPSIQTENYREPVEIPQKRISEPEKPKSKPNTEVRPKDISQVKPYLSTVGLEKNLIPEYSTDKLKIYAINDDWVRETYPETSIGDRNGVDFAGEQ